MRMRNFLVILAAVVVAQGYKSTASKKGLHADLMEFEALIPFDKLQRILVANSNNNDVRTVTDYLSAQDAIDAKKAILKIHEIKNIMNWIELNYDDYMPAHNNKVTHNITTKHHNNLPGAAPGASHISTDAAHKDHNKPTGGNGAPGVVQNAAVLAHKVPAVAQNAPSSINNKSPASHNSPPAAHNGPTKAKKPPSSVKKKSTAKTTKNKVAKKKMAKKISARTVINGYNVYVQDLIDIVPMDEVKQLIERKLLLDGGFSTFYNKMHEVEKPIKHLIQLPEVAKLVQHLKEIGVNVVKPWEFFKDFFDWK